ncbi:serine protease [Anabaena sp. UHCC 0253]|uniref:tetratricopeptide repeat-containing S1 family peptidase n=1 Tax=Anabaena sp. UHCC 0253 TaxID=2590019 RepID=UPI001447911E|nr:tetratricopeptide repeat-containing serine protease family protein [Anabaena sp. UHCC 0253]MTJ53454.1 serine protease [Anabaena sp. UHCC 0253]
MKLSKNLYKLSHLCLFFLLLFPASPIIITGCSSSLFARKPGTLSESELKNILKEITVKVIVDDRETASGTIIKKQNGFYTVLTNAHVIENAKSVKVVTPDNQVHEVEFSKLDRQDNKKDDLYDLAKLTFSSETTYLFAGLGEEDIKLGEKVFAGGYVKGNLQTTKGTAKLFLNQPLIKGQQIAYNNDIQQGMSGGAIINEKGYLVGINSKLAHPVLQTDFRYLQGEQPDENTFNEWGNYSWGIAVNLVDEAAPDLALFPERVIRKIGGIPAKVLDIAKQSSVQIKKADGGIGSGVIIAKDNDIYYVLTAAHVVENKQEYQVVAPDKQVYKVDNQTIRTRKGLDMAVIQFRSSQVYQVATLGDYKLKEQYVFLYGWKGEESNHPSLFSVGKMLDAERREIWAQPRGYELAYTNEGYPGMSGGGIWDTEGRLVGIHNASVTDVLGYSLGLSIQRFIFYQKQVLWKLPENKLNLSKKNPLSKDVNSINIPKPSTPELTQVTDKEWLNYGVKLWRIGEKEEAMISMTKAIEKNTDLWEALYNVAFIGFEKIKYDDMLNIMYEEIKRNVTQRKQNDDTLKYDDTLKIINYSIRKTNNKRKNDSILYIDIINYAIKKKPTFYQSYLVKGLMLERLKEYQNALSTLSVGIEEAKTEKKENFLLYALRGQIFLQLQQYDKAINDYNQSIDIYPQNTNAYNSRGIAYSKQGKTDLAIDDYTQAITIDPQFVEAYTNRGATYNQQGKIDLAIADFTDAIAIEPIFAKAYYNRGVVYLEQEKVDLAIDDYTQAITIDPQFIEAYYNRGVAYEKQGKTDLAIADYTQAITINSQFTQAYHNRGVSYGLKGNKQQAIKDLETAKQLYKQQGNTEEYQKVQEIKL